MLKVLMYPPLSRFESSAENGIKRVIEAYYRLGSTFGIEFVECDLTSENEYDLFSCHAGTTNSYPKYKPIVSHLHGLYWTSDYQATLWEWKANSNVIESIRRAHTITVPSRWVAETIARDVRVYPRILPHGIDWWEWEHNFNHEGYVLWNKNRSMDVCDPTAIGYLAKQFPEIVFRTTFAPTGAKLHNIDAIGLKPHAEMKELVQKSAVYLSTTKETFGIGILEALASGVPVLGYNYGGNAEIVQHGVDGYLAAPGDLEDLAKGLVYCNEYRETLSSNAKKNVQRFMWDETVEYLSEIYQDTYDTYQFNRRVLSIPKSLYSVA